jgi:hypothetical protein
LEAEFNEAKLLPKTKEDAIMAAAAYDMGMKEEVMPNFRTPPR